MLPPRCRRPRPSRLGRRPERRQPGRYQPEVARHREHKQRQPQRHADDQLAALVGQLARARRRLDIFGAAGIGRGGLDHAVAGPFHGGL